MFLHICKITFNKKVWVCKFVKYFKVFPKEEIYNPPITDFSFQCLIVVFSLICFIYCVDDSLIVLNCPEYFNTTRVLGFKDTVFNLVVYYRQCCCKFSNVILTENSGAPIINLALARHSCNLGVEYILESFDLSQWLQG